MSSAPRPSAGLVHPPVHRGVRKEQGGFYSQMAFGAAAVDVVGIFAAAETISAKA
jgi:hypothetical protein